MYCLFINIFLVNSFSCLSTVVEITELMMRHGVRIDLYRVEQCTAIQINKKAFLGGLS